MKIRLPQLAPLVVEEEVIGGNSELTTIINKTRQIVDVTRPADNSVKTKGSRKWENTRTFLGIREKYGLKRLGLCS